MRCRYQSKKKLNLFKLTPFMVNSVLAEGKGGFIRAKLVCKTLENFFASADEELTIDHVPIWCKDNQGQRVMVEQSEKLVSTYVSLELEARGEESQDTLLHLPSALHSFRTLVGRSVGVGTLGPVCRL